MNPTLKLTSYPASNPTLALTYEPSANPTSLPGGALVSFLTYLNIQLTDCDSMNICTACQYAIELAQQQLINATLHVLANVTYIGCIFGRRRLSEISRQLAITSRVTLKNTFPSPNPIKDSDTAKATVNASVQNGAFTTLVQENSKK